jgi:hypothetical protein
VTTADRDRGGSARTQVEIAETTPLVNWTALRPAPPARRPGEIELARAAVNRLVRGSDDRLSALAAGALRADHWTRHGGPAPASGLDVGIPTVRDTARESFRAGVVAGDESPAVATARTDAARITARGIQEWLAWAYVQDYPTPLWLVGAMPATEIHAWVLGAVGLGPGGLDGPASTAPFASTVAERIEALRRDLSV